jgi:hypothetical protein
VDLYSHFPIRLHGVVLNYLSTRTSLPFNNIAFFRQVAVYVLTATSDRPKDEKNSASNRPILEG